MLCEIEKFSPYIWECACGEGHLSKELTRQGYTVCSTDLIDRGFGRGGVDFLATETIWDGDIITNPPFKYANEFVIKANEIIGKEHKVAFFLPITFLEGQKRKAIFEKYPPARIWVSSSRIKCVKNADFSISNGMAAYSWWIWEKDYIGETIIKWFN